MKQNVKGLFIKALNCDYSDIDYCRYSLLEMLHNMGIVKKMIDDRNEKALEIMKQFFEVYAVDPKDNTEYVDNSEPFPKKTIEKTESPVCPGCGDEYVSDLLDYIEEPVKCLECDNYFRIEKEEFFTTKLVNRKKKK